MRCSKEDLACLLGVKKGTLINIEKNKQLEMRLEKKGYKLLGKEKAGRNVYYTLEQTSPEKEIYSNMVKYVFNAESEDKFADYFIVRTENEGIPLGKKDVAKATDLSVKTIGRFDNKMLEAKIIEEDGYYYFVLENGVSYQCTHTEYKKYWSNMYSIKSYKNLHRMFEDGEITLNELKLAIEGKKELQKKTDLKYCYRIKRYKINKDNELYITAIDCIKSMYGKGDF